MFSQIAIELPTEALTERLNTLSTTIQVSSARIVAEADEILWSFAQSEFDLDLSRVPHRTTRENGINFCDGKGWSAKFGLSEHGHPLAVFDGTPPIGVFSDEAIHRALNTAVARLFGNHTTIHEDLSEEERIKAIWHTLEYIANVEGCSDHGNLRLVSRGLEYLIKETPQLDITWERWNNAYVFTALEEPEWFSIAVNFAGRLEGDEGIVDMFDWLVLDSGERVDDWFDAHTWGGVWLPVYASLRGVVEDVPFLNWASLLKTIDLLDTLVS